MNTKDKGDISEQRITLDLLESGYSVSEPVGDNQRYDLILDTGVDLLKVQVKTATTTGEGSIKFNCQSSYLLSDGSVERGYTANEVDLFAVYCHNTGDIAYIPVEETPNSEMRLRDEKKSGRSNVLSDYKLDGIVEN